MIPALIIVYFVYFQENKLCAHPFMEIYDGDITHFMAPLAKQDEFYIPETEDTPLEDEQDSSYQEEEDQEEVRESSVSHGLKLKRPKEEEATQEQSEAVLPVVEKEKKEEEVDAKEEVGKKEEQLVIPSAGDAGTVEGKDTVEAGKVAEKQDEPKKDHQGDDGDKVTQEKVNPSGSGEGQIKVTVKGEGDDVKRASSEAMKISTPLHKKAVQDSGVSSSTDTITDSMSSDISSPSSLSYTSSHSSPASSETSGITDASVATGTTGASFYSTESKMTQDGSALAQFSSDSETETEPFEVVNADDVK